ncbi:hypothetical protein P171DRAFT_286835 [Karstenula rhodostoma CBS 690.94]|uniref:Uncharacterized protein n=1 Tax=Karstenula rhodostoma CBS 690.94 TaxID=1392251 RepID=A0A9P4PJ93_9PLEO|nr:hypothetical protein P171DRAFT_286835 [Karstenula rhodostoma CBS 690.94]
MMRHPNMQGCIFGIRIFTCRWRQFARIVQLLAAFASCVHVTCAKSGVLIASLNRSSTSRLLRPSLHRPRKANHRPPPPASSHHPVAGLAWCRSVRQHSQTYLGPAVQGFSRVACPFLQVASFPPRPSLALQGTTRRCSLPCPTRASSWEPASAQSGQPACFRIFYCRSPIPLGPESSIVFCTGSFHLHLSLTSSSRLGYR